MPTLEQPYQAATYSATQVTDTLRNLFYSSGDVRCSEIQLNALLALIPNDAQFRLIGFKEIVKLPTKCPTCSAPTSLVDTNIQKLLDAEKPDHTPPLPDIMHVLSPTTCEHCATHLPHLEILEQRATEQGVQPENVNQSDVIAESNYTFPVYGRNGVHIGYGNTQDRVVGRTGAIDGHNKIGFVGMAEHIDVAPHAFIHHLVSKQIIIKDPFDLGLVITSSLQANANMYNDGRSRIDVLFITPGDGAVELQKVDIGVLLVADHAGTITFGSDTKIEKAFYYTDVEPDTGSNVTVSEEEFLDTREMLQLFQTGVKQGGISLFLDQLRRFANYKAIIRDFK
ncbi:MAG TPA: hypothetical protein VMR81_07395 [Patescibacteria group bacterium]|nr:hypothetical protein [Patescibacteria group bacterium]